MNVEALITSEEANEVAYLIQEYLNKGGTGFCEASHSLRYSMRYRKLIES